jgi:hypothetical protein
MSAARSFNEAAAKWPRKAAPHRLGRMGSARFNEAAAKWPRKATALGRMHGNR